MLPAVLPLDAVLGVVLYWVALGLAGLARPSDLAFVSRVLFPLSAAGSLVLTFSGAAAVLGSPDSAVLPLGLPIRPFTCAWMRCPPSS